MLSDKEGKSSGKKKYKYYCNICDYGCRRKFLMQQHEKTQKHKSAYSVVGNAQNAHSKICYHTCSCGKKYKHVQSFNRHKKNCEKSEEEEEYENLQIVVKEGSISPDADLKEMITALIEQNKSILLENKEMRGIVKDLIPKVGSNNTTNYNSFNINVFLNETCKDALNLTEFVNTLKLESADLDITRENGYAKGIANIFLKGLRDLDVEKRPIHCSDLKREVLYVKDDDTWEKEAREKPKIRKAISTIAKKQINAIKDWEAKHPGWMYSDKGQQEYCEMVREVTSCAGSDETENKIIRTIAKEVIIDKDI
uniref:C2H2-type domain-containing protein n=1 Tax=viral metagenome TaxID=1070528 RepID=A0A6C0CQV9_9ZZZZ